MPPRGRAWRASGIDRILQTERGRFINVIGVTAWRCAEERGYEVAYSVGTSWVPEWTQAPVRPMVADELARAV